MYCINLFNKHTVCLKQLRNYFYLILSNLCSRLCASDDGLFSTFFEYVRQSILKVVVTDILEHSNHIIKTIDTNAYFLCLAKVMPP